MAATRHTPSVRGLLAGEGFDGEALEQEPMARHTTYRIGGPARFYVRVDSAEALASLVEACDEEGAPRIIVGGGSNLLVADAGFSGAVVALGRDFRALEVDEDRGRLLAGAGTALSAVVQEAARRSLGGLEFAVGTPGTVGGALRMNAGSRDEWIGARVANVTTYVPGRGLVQRAGPDVDWGYRSSSFAADEVIVGCEIAVHADDSSRIRERMDANIARRRETQPLDKPSCGSVFRNPDGASAARLIDDLGLKGTRIGDAEVSAKHANFIVNVGEATAQDVRSLISLIAGKVREAYGIELTPEVRFIGFD